MIGMNSAILIGTVRGLRLDGAGGRFWLDTSVEYTDREGKIKTLDDSVLVRAPKLPTGKDGAATTKDGVLVMVAGAVDNGILVVKEVETKITEVVASAVSRVEAGTPGMNRLHWAARLAGDPEMRYTNAGAAVATLLTVNGGDRQKNIPGVWIRGTLWRNQAAWANDNLLKGSRVALTGRVFTERWENREGAPQWTTKLHIDDLFVQDDEDERPSARTSGGHSPVTGATTNLAATRKLAAPVPGDEVFEDTVGDDSIPF